VGNLFEDTTRVRGGPACGRCSVGELLECGVVEA